MTIRLERLTQGSGRVERPAGSSAQARRFSRHSDHMITLGELCELVASRVTLLIEVKSHFDGDRRLISALPTCSQAIAGRGADVVRPGPMAALRGSPRGSTRGIVAERRYSHRDGSPLGRGQAGAPYFTHALATRPQFIAYSLKDLPSALPTAARRVLKLPL